MRGSGTGTWQVSDCGVGGCKSAQKPEHLSAAKLPLALTHLVTLPAQPLVSVLQLLSCALCSCRQEAEVVEMMQPNTRSSGETPQPGSMEHSQEHGRRGSSEGPRPLSLALTSHVSHDKVHPPGFCCSRCH